MPRLSPSARLGALEKRGTRFRRHYFWLLFALGLFGSPPVNAAPPDPLQVEVAPLLGERAQATLGWYGYLVRIKNDTSVARRGRLTLLENRGTVGLPTRGGALLETTFAVEPGELAILELPVHGYLGQGVEAILEQDGEVVGKGAAEHASSGESILFDLTQPSRIARGFVSRGFAQAPSSTSAGLPPPIQSFAVSTPHVEAKTGRVLLPTYAAAYSGATAVLTESEGLESMSERELVALSGWVQAGGTLAVAVTRPEDLRGAVLSRLVGGELRAVAPEPRQLAPVVREVPSEGAALGTTGAETQARSAARSIQDALVTHHGGNLRQTQFGAVASYGMGEVHVLSFNPNRAPFLGDPWVEFQLTDLLERTLRRQSLVASPFGVRDPSDWRVDAVKRSLDPNVGNHWVIVLSAGLLIAYALLAGPLNFQLAQRAKRPLRALVRLPAIALFGFLVILSLGWISKGGRSRARHLTLVEASAGMPRASAVRFRAFYGPSADDLVVRPTSRDGVLDLTEPGELSRRKLHIERDGFRLDGFAARPWETVLVREDGFIQLGAGIAMQDVGDDVAIWNRSGKDLAAVVVLRPDGRLFLIERIEDQSEVLASSGSMLAASWPNPVPSGPLDLHAYQQKLDAIAPGLSQALEAWATLSDGVTFWPSGVPVLLAQWVGGEGSLRDSGQLLDSDRVILRVVGRGGAP